MTICEVTRNEYLEIIEIWEASVKATHDFLTEDDIQYLKPLILNEYLAAVTLRSVKDESGRILGFLGVYGDGIEMLFIDPQNRSNGIGRLLVEYAIENLGTTKVDVNEQNPQAAGFYEHMGFKVVDRSPLDGQGKPFPILHMALPA